MAWNTFLVKNINHTIHKIYQVKRDNKKNVTVSREEQNDYKKYRRKHRNVFFV